MEGTEAIIKRILDDAEKKANIIIKNAENSANEELSKANEWANSYKKTQLDVITKNAEDIVVRRKTVAELDVRKLVLKAKHEVLGEIFSKALEKLCSFEKKEYIDFVNKLLVQYAEENDAILLSKYAPLSKEDLEGLKVFVDKKLTFLSNEGDFKGGFILANESCDKNLSFEALLEEKKNYLEAQLQKKLFN